MPLPRRTHASLVLLLVLAAGLGTAAAAGAAALGEASCCPATLEAEAACTWLGTADCCPERPVAPAPVSAAPAAPPALTPYGVAAAPLSHAPGAPALPSRVHTVVLRL
jgi:hypothetical protein